MLNEKIGLPEEFDDASMTDMEVALCILGYMDEPYEHHKSQNKGCGKGNGGGNGGKSLNHGGLVEEALREMKNPFAKDLLTRFTLADLSDSIP
jgi:hypothetical protein